MLDCAIEKCRSEKRGGRQKICSREKSWIVNKTVDDKRVQFPPTTLHYTISYVISKLSLARAFPIWDFLFLFFSASPISHANSPTCGTYYLPDQEGKAQLSRTETTWYTFEGFFE